MLPISGNIYMKHELLKLLIAEKAVIRLGTIGNNRYHTRELLNIVKERGYGHKVLLKAHGIDRERTN